MCKQVIERFAACGCIYYQHAVDQCPKYNQKHHQVQIKEVAVGQLCASHSLNGAQEAASGHEYPDSGYQSGYYSSTGHR